MRAGRDCLPMGISKDLIVIDTVTICPSVIAFISGDALRSINETGK